MTVTTTEDRARAAMRAIAGTVNDAPPLLLTPVSAPGAVPDEVSLGEHRAGPYRRRPDSPRSNWPGPGTRSRGRSGSSRRRWAVLAPVAAAAVVVAVAVALVLVRSIPNGRVASPPSPAASARPVSGPATAGVPEYYVAWMQASRPYLAVGNTFTGQRVATIMSPPDVSIKAVYGSAEDGRTFVFAGQATPAAGGGTVWYRLRLSLNGNAVLQYGALPITVSQVPAGAALSPDGTELAIALPGSTPALRVYSVATGALLRSWTTKTPGEIMTEKTQPGSWLYTATTLRWSPDGRQLAFDWNGLQIRSIDATAADGDLIAASRLAAVTGTTYDTLGTVTCDAAQGWQLTGDGQGIVCAGSTHSFENQPCGSGRQCTYIQRDLLGFIRQPVSGQGGTATGFYDGEPTAGAAKAGDGAYLGWANADGSVVVGSLVNGGQARFGIFRDGNFTPLPALPASLPTPAGALLGTVAW